MVAAKPEGAGVRNQLITVFGGTGFIGRHLIRRLAARGARVLVPSRNPARGNHLQPMGRVGQIVVEPMDLGNDGALARALAGASGVVNLIGILHESRQQRFEAVQGALPGRIAALAAAAGIARMVQLSAIGADAGSPSAYARSKAEGEGRVRETLPSAVVLRPSIVVGPEDNFFNRFAEMARWLPALPLIGGGETRFQPVYVGDVAEAIVAGLQRPDAAGQTYALGGPQVYSFAELMRYMLAVVDRRRLLVPLSFGTAALLARFLGLLPSPPLTRDQVELLKRDNVVGEGARGLAELGVAPTPIELVVPEYLARFRAGPARMARL
jgi:NADH dehydrogenase